MKFVQLEGAHPLEQPKWEGHYLFPRTLFRVRSSWAQGLQSRIPEQVAVGWEV